MRDAIDDPVFKRVWYGLSDSVSTESHAHLPWWCSLTHWMEQDPQLYTGIPRNLMRRHNPARAVSEEVERVLERVLGNLW